MDTFPQIFGLGTAPQVWLFSDFEGYNQLRELGYPAYLTPLRKARLERIRQARLLHDGRHWRLFLFEGRTQFDFPAMSTQGREKQTYVPYNLLKLVSLKAADLLFGDDPTVSVDDELQSQKLDALAERSSIHKLLYGLAVEASVDGEVYIEAVIQGGQVYLKRVDAADIFPEGLLQPDGQYASYVRYNARNLGTDDNPEWRLLVTRYLAGKITREVKALDQKGTVLPMVLTLEVWPQENPEDEPLEAETNTGIDRNTVTYIPNLIVRDLPVSDYDGLVETQDLLNAKQTQLARVLAKHSDPKLAAPASAVGPDGTLPAQSEVFFYRSKDEIPQYITWNAEISNALADRNEARSALLLMSETSPILLGIKDHATAHNAYKSVRLEATNSLTKAQRKAVIWKAAIKRMLGVAQDLEQTIPGERYDRQPVAVEMNDGLPIDTDAQANEISVLRAAGVMSVDRAVGILIPDAAAQEKELEALKEEKASATPSIFMGQGEGGAGTAGDHAATGQAVTSDQGPEAPGEAAEEQGVDVAA